jgi:hypothetical protein
VVWVVLTGNTLFDMDYGIFKEAEVQLQAQLMGKAEGF